MQKYAQDSAVFEMPWDFLITSDVFAGTGNSAEWKIKQRFHEPFCISSKLWAKQLHDFVQEFPDNKWYDSHTNRQHSLEVKISKYRQSSVVAATISHAASKLTLVDSP